MNTKRLIPSVITSLILLSSAMSAHAGLRLPAVISTHAILQADKPVAIWGWAAPGDAITVTLKTADATAGDFHATADANGRWAGSLPALKAGIAGQLQVSAGKGETLTVDDILVGEVWLCGGQSNMSYLVNSPSKNVNESTTPALLTTAKNEAAAAMGNLRYFATRHVHTDTPMDDVEGKWIIATPETVGGCFALSWNFAVELHDKIHEPIGLIDSAVGGTVCEAWTPKPELDASSAGPELEKRYQARFDHLAPAVKAKSDAGNSNIPARLYNGMIRGLEPYTLKGVIWFQGDGNCPHPADYGVLFKTLITAWRSHFHDANLPFYYVEMQNYARPQQKPVEPNALSEIREQQQAALELPNVDVATGVDVGIRIPNYEAHFPDKKPLGKRLAGLALNYLYGQPGLVHSPHLKSFKIEGNKIRLQLEYADGLRIRGNGDLTGFAIRGAQGEWLWAQGKIEGTDIVVLNDQIAKPTDVRYAWAYNPLISVENSSGLPLRPFRTDMGSEH